MIDVNIINNVARMINYYICYNNLINLSCTRTEETCATYVRTLTLATYFKSVEHIIQVWNYCGTCINYRNLIDIYEEY